MIDAAIVGLGWWGRTLVESVVGDEPAGGPGGGGAWAGGERRLRFVAAATRSRSEEVEAFARAHGLRLAPDLDSVLADPSIDAVVLATPHSLHPRQVAAAAQARKHVFCEKPLALTRREAEAAVEAVRRAGVTLGIGYNRRFHPEMAKLKQRIRSGELGVVLHLESTMTFPNSLSLAPGHWRASRSETPCGALTPMGVHAIDAMIDLCGEVEQVFAQSFQRAVQIDADDTTSVLMRMKRGMSAYLGAIAATGPGFSFSAFGSRGWVRLEGVTHVAGASSEERRTRLFSTCTFQPTAGSAEVWQSEPFDSARASLESFAAAAAAGRSFPISLDEMVHGVAVTEAIVRSAASGLPEPVS
jgi:predicted dehydrogenase